jgi:hypothetical protein
VELPPSVFATVAANRSRGRRSRIVPEDDLSDDSLCSIDSLTEFHDDDDENDEDDASEEEEEQQPRIEPALPPFVALDAKDSLLRHVALNDAQLAASFFPRCAHLVRSKLGQVGEFSAMHDRLRQSLRRQHADMTRQHDAATQSLLRLKRKRARLLAHVHTLQQQQQQQQENEQQHHQEQQHSSSAKPVSTVAQTQDLLIQRAHVTELAHEAFQLNQQFASARQTTLSLLSQHRATLVPLTSAEQLLAQQRHIVTPSAGVAGSSAAAAAATAVARAQADRMLRIVAHHSTPQAFIASVPY